MLSFLPKIPKDITEELRAKFKARRKSLKYTQDELSSRSSVSLGSLKRFESSGKISLESLLKLALVLECLEDFSCLCEKEEERFGSIDEVLNEK
jgi:transcriptional regulator with XRE-family HTH domain